MINKQKKQDSASDKQSRVNGPPNNKQQSKLQHSAKEIDNINKKQNSSSDKQRTRNIPAAVRDEVFSRDNGRCTFVGENGKRCNSTWNLEIDHIVPFAKGGNNSSENLRLFCAKHNLMEAERAYGKDFMKKYTKKE